MARNPVTLRTRWLAEMLRGLRDEAGLTLAEAAEYLGRNGSVLSRMETGELPIRSEDVEALLDLYRVTEPKRRDALLRFHRTAALPAWWDVYSTEVAEAVIELAWFESLATGMRIYSATLVDGLLQTADYARTVAVAADVEGSGEVDRWVEMAMIRQNVLARATPPSLDVVIDEAVLCRPVGGPAVMAAQFRHLLALGQRPTIDIRVLPFAAGAHASPDSGFRLFELIDPLSEVVTAGCALGELYVEPPRAIRYRAVYDALRQAALDPRESAELISAAADDLEQA